MHDPTFLLLMSLADPLLIAFILAQLADVATTWWALKHIRGAHEGNGLLAPLVKRVGPVGGLLAVKIPLAAYVVYAWQHMWPQAHWVVLAISAGFGISNVVVIQKARSR